LKLKLNFKSIFPNDSPSVLLRCLGLLLAPAANAARVVVSAGAVEIEVIDWAVHVYVTKVNTTTGLSERVSNFKVRLWSFRHLLLTFLLCSFRSSSMSLSMLESTGILPHKVLQVEK
jgi:hypothetical protein